MLEVTIININSKQVPRWFWQLSLNSMVYHKQLHILRKFLTFLYVVLYLLEKSVTSRLTAPNKTLVYAANIGMHAVANPHG